MRNRLGQSGLEISRVVLGSMGHRATTRQQRARTLDAALDAGITSIDTAPLYGFGQVESELGALLEGRRARVELLSKVGLRWDDVHGEVLFEFRDEQGVQRAVRRDSRPEAIRRDLEASLRRLRTDVIDLCQIHHPDRSVPIADAMGTLEALRSEGKVREIGVSNFTGPEIEAAMAGLSRCSLASDQLEYNLLKRTADHEIVPLAREHGFGLLAYSPLDAGSLAGRPHGAALEDGRRHRATFQDANARVIHAAIERVSAPLARNLDASVAQVSLAWILHQPGFAAVVVGASSEEQVRANARAAELSLGPEQLSVLDETFSSLSLRPPSGESLTRRARRFLGRVRRRLSG